MPQLRAGDVRRRDGVLSAQSTAARPSMAWRTSSGICNSNCAERSSTLLVLIGSTLMSSGDIDSNTLTRIVQLVLIGVYMILASLFLETRNWKFLQNQP